MTTQSHLLFTKAKQLIPGGVSSPVRSFNGVKGQPFFVKGGEGPFLIDVDDNKYIDYVCSWGPLILGHAHPYIVEKVSSAIQKGFSFGTPTEIEVELAEKICHFMPAIEKIRFVSSGTEAAMSAIRLARGYTKRNKIIKFSGCYHGHADSMLVSAGSGSLTFGIPNSAGVPSDFAQHTLVATYNHLDEVRSLFHQYKYQIAAIILEPVAGNMNLVLPTKEFLQGLRALCDEYDSLLIFDEVITGFRVSLGGAQDYYDIKPDLTILGKIIGGGLPAAAFGGRAAIMDKLAPLGPVYQAGTLSGNPIAMTAGNATLDIISATGFYQTLSARTNQLVQGLQTLADQYAIPFKGNAIGGMFGFCFTPYQIQNEEDVKKCDKGQFMQFFYGMLKHGVYFAPSTFEIGFVSSMHEEKQIEQTLQAANHVFKEMTLCIELSQVLLG